MLFPQVPVLSPGEAHSPDGLVNIDYILIEGDGITPIDLLPSYRLTVNQNDVSWGTVSPEPVQTYYDQNTVITLSV